jgi:flagellar protein FliO/FliZ
MLRPFFPQTADGSTRLGRRALLLGGGLVLLFLTLRLMTPSTPAAPPVVEQSESGAEAFHGPYGARSSYRLFSAGNVVALLLLAGGGALALYLRRRTTPGGDASALLEPVGHLHLAAGQQLRLVRCGDDVLLLGVTAGQITLLQRYPADAFAEALPAGAEISSRARATAPAAGFAHLLRSLTAPSSHA